MTGLHLFKRVGVFEDVVTTVVDGNVLSVAIMDTPGREDDLNQLPAVRRSNLSNNRSRMAFVEAGK